MAAVAITRDEHTAAELRHEAARCPDSGAARRMLALIKEGRPRHPKGCAAAQAFFRPGSVLL